MSYVKRPINHDRFPFRVGEVRLAYPGTLNGQRTEHDPRPEFAGFEWHEEAWPGVVNSWPIVGDE